LLELDSLDALTRHPIYGHSFEGLVIENVLSVLPGGWRATFFRTAQGAEIDLVLEKGTRRVAVECKASVAPDLESGFFRAREDLSIQQALVVAPVREPYPIGAGTLVVPPTEAIRRAAAEFPITGRARKGSP
jgi:hypothetical protein